MFMDNDIYFAYHLLRASVDTLPTCLAFCGIQPNRFFVTHFKSSLIDDAKVDANSLLRKG
jgi:hypothetical protein